MLFLCYYYSINCDVNIKFFQSIRFIFIKIPLYQSSDIKIICNDYYALNNIDIIYLLNNEVIIPTLAIILNIFVIVKICTLYLKHSLDEYERSRIKFLLLYPIVYFFTMIIYVCNGIFALLTIKNGKNFY